MDWRTLSARLPAIALLAALPGGALAQSDPPAQQPRLIFSPWTEVCVQELASSGRTCATAKDIRDINKQLRDPHDPWRNDDSTPPWKDDRLLPRERLRP
jgi:hypothetical protein